MESSEPQQLQLQVAIRRSDCESAAGAPALDVLRSALLQALSTSLRAPNSEFEEEEEEDLFDIADVTVEPREGSTQELLVRGGVPGLRQMQLLRDQVLSGDFDAAANRALGKNSPVSLQASRTEFVQEYEDCVLRLQTLTPHQREKVEECAGVEGSNGVHLRAPAGAGKTFVSLQRALDTLLGDGQKYVLFVARNKALAYFAASWIGKRVQGSRKRRQVLSRLHVMHFPLEQGLHKVAVGKERVGLQPFTGDAVEYALLIVDEAHHLYGSAESRGYIEAHFKEGTTQRLLLSDISQSLGHDMDYPDRLQDVYLSEVVRCSKRIVAGAMAFQLGGEEKLLTKCHHEATGPPLKSFLFDVPSEDSNRFAAYAKHTLQALEHVMSSFDGLSLHNRLAVVVPSREFLDAFRPELEQQLKEHFPERHMRLVDATCASACLGLRARRALDGNSEDEGTIREDSMTRVAEEIMSDDEVEDDDLSEWLVYDTIQEVDGLERLIVLGVGLDSVIGASSGVSAAEADPEGDSLQSRSMLYRAVTRAHLMFVVVNEFLRGGWLEFLGSVRLRDDEAFNSREEMDRSETQAVEGLVKEELGAMMAAAADQGGVKLEDKALAALTKDVATIRERGEAASTEAAIHIVIQAWKNEAAHVMAALQLAVSEQSARETDTDLEALAAPLTLAFHRGEVANLATAAAEALKAQRDRLQEATAQRALHAAAAEVKSAGGCDGIGSHDLTSAALTILKPRLVALVTLEGQAWDVAARTLAQEWLQLEQLVSQKWTAVLAGSGERLDKEAEQKLRAEVSDKAWQGQSVEEAATNALHGWQRCKSENTITEALETARQSAVQKCICHIGGKARVRDLLKAPELNGQECTLEGFDLESARWTVRLPKQKVNVRPKNLDALSPSQLLQNQTLGDSLPKLKALVKQRTSRIEKPTLSNLAAPAGEVVSSFLQLQQQVAAALEASARAKQVHLEVEELFCLAGEVIQQRWRELEEEQEQAEAEEEDVDFFSTASMETLASEALVGWEQRQHLHQAEAARVASALQAAADVRRLVLTEAACAALQQRVAQAVRQGTALQDAVAAALDEWHKQQVRRKVQQTIWDSSGNSTKRVTGVVRFMPFKMGAEKFDYELLVMVFRRLPLQCLHTLAPVCKRWRSVANDPSWKPDLLFYAWGEKDMTGLATKCPRPTLLSLCQTHRVVRIAVADHATFVVTETGAVMFWGKSWLPEAEPNCIEPTLIPELRDVVTVTTTPAGYFHGRGAHGGYACAALTREGSLYTWGFGEVLHRSEDRKVSRPRRVTSTTHLDKNGEAAESWRPLSERVLHVACGLGFIALCVERLGERTLQGAAQAEGTAVLTCGDFCYWRRAGATLKECPELRDLPLRQLTAGLFHCCALTPGGELYTWGHMRGKDASNGNLLGQGPIDSDEDECPRRVQAEGLGPVAEVSCSSYTTLAITMDGRAFSWGDCDGDALGHEARRCDTPTWLTGLRWQRVAHGSLAYTNGAVATDQGRVFVWGGNMWQGGIAAGRDSRGPTEVTWSGVPDCYRCSSVELAHRHGFLAFRKQP